MNLNYHILLKILGLITTIGGISLLPAFFVAYLYDEPEVMKATALSAVIMLLVGIPATSKMKLKEVSLKLREGYLVVALCWLVLSILGAFPYYFAGYSSFVDALFESVSGFTTTGSTVSDVDYMPRGLMMWKAISHWLGGMGILVFVISILPTLGIGGQKIVKAEAPGPKLDKVATRLTDSTKFLYLTYISFTIVEFLLLALGPMDIYDALVNTMGSISTGGLFTHSQGLVYYDSVYTELVMGLFTILSSVNYVLYYYAVRGKIGDVIRDIELRAFLVILAISIILVSAGLYAYGTYESLSQSLRYAFFQVVSFGTTTGYAICDYTSWPTVCIAIMFALMFIGGCAASTCGSIKVIRILVLFKLIGRGIYKRIHPRSVVAVKLGGKPILAPIVSQITGFILLYFVIFLLSCLVLSLQNLDMTTTISTAAGALSNTGLGFGSLGSTGNMGAFSDLLKLYICLLMIVGRLELFTVILLLTPSFWNSDR